MIILHFYPILCILYNQFSVYTFTKHIFLVLLIGKEAVNLIYMKAHLDDFIENLYINSDLNK